MEKVIHRLHWGVSACTLFGSSWRQSLQGDSFTGKMVLKRLLISDTGEVSTHSLFRSSRMLSLGQIILLAAWSGKSHSLVTLANPLNVYVQVFWEIEL